MSELMVMSEAGIPLAGELLSFRNESHYMKVYFHFTGENEERCIKFQSFEEEKKRPVEMWLSEWIMTLCWLVYNNLHIKCTHTQR